MSGLSMDGLAGGEWLSDLAGDGHQDHIGPVLLITLAADHHGGACHESEPPSGSSAPQSSGTGLANRIAKGTRLVIAVGALSLIRIKIRQGYPP